MIKLRWPWRKIKPRIPTTAERQAVQAAKIIEEQRRVRTRLVVSVLGVPRNWVSSLEVIRREWIRNTSTMHNERHMLYRTL